jgi:hypothetical protein
LLTFFGISLITFGNPIKLVAGVIIFVISFIIFAVVTQTLKNADLANIREVANVMGPLRKPLTMVINVIEKLMNITKRE